MASSAREPSTDQHSLEHHPRCSSIGANDSGKFSWLNYRNSNRIFETSANDLKKIVFPSGAHIRPKILEACATCDGELMLNSFGDVVFVVFLQNWSKTHHLLWACGRDMHYFTDTSAPEPIIQAINEDISVRMKRRAVNGYGMHVDTLADNAALLEGDTEVARIWPWLDAIRSVEGLDSSDGITFRGVKSILAGLPGKSRTEVKYEHWSNGSPPGRGGNEGVPVYTSNERYGEKMRRALEYKSRREVTSLILSRYRAEITVGK